MNPIIYAIPAFFGLIGIELLIARRQGKSIYRTNDAITSLNLGVMSQIVGAFSKTASIGIYSLLVDKFGTFSFDVGNPLVWILALILYDLCYYWLHRAGHEVNVLWAAHQVHHSSEDYNLSTALRQTSTGFLFGWIFFIPMAVLGIPVLVFVVVGLIDLLYQFWVHSELVPKLGWFDRVFVSPSNHRVHHGRNAYCIDKNYGGIWIIWDRMFGTFEEERDNEKVVYGTLKPLHSWNPIKANIQGYTDIVHSALTTPHWGHKLMHVFAPPGWQPGLQPGVKSADSENTFQRFETPTARWQHLYGLLGFTIIAGYVIHFLVVAPTLNATESAGYAALMVATIACLSPIFEGARWAIVLEAVRATLCFGALIAGVWFAPVSSVFQIAAGLALALTLLLLLPALSSSARASTHRTTT